MVLSCSGRALHFFPTTSNTIIITDLVFMMMMIYPPKYHPKMSIKSPKIERGVYKWGENIPK
jgi:hypothetical protein